MARLSDHTRLVNACIGFAMDVPKWPSPLHQAGYRLDTIEPNFINSREDKVNPDILFSSNRAVHTLVTECKRGHLSEDRIEKYGAITPENLRSEVDHIHDVNKLSNESLYVGTEKTEQSFDYLDFPDAGVILANGEYYSRNGFDDAELNSKLEGGELPDRYPTHYYPFSANDSRAVIAEKVSQHLMHVASQGEGIDEEFEPGEVASEIHEYWDAITLSAKSELSSKVEDVLELFERRNLDDDMRQIEGSRTYYVRTSQAFQRKCQEVIQELSTDEDLDDFLG